MQRAHAGILAGGLAAGLFDILYAFVLAAWRDRTPLTVLQSVASGLLGAGAYKSGAAGATLGLALHLAITITAALVYGLAYRRSPTMRRHFVACGLLFGALVYPFMNFVVLPLSAVPFHLRYTPAIVAQGLVSHALLVGLPISWCLHRFGQPGPTPAAPVP